MTIPSLSEVRDSEVSGKERKRLPVPKDCPLCPLSVLSASSALRLRVPYLAACLCCKVKQSRERAVDTVYNDTAYAHSHKNHKRVVYDLSP